MKPPEGSDFPELPEGLPERIDLEDCVETTIYENPDVRAGLKELSGLPLPEVVDDLPPLPAPMYAHYQHIAMTNHNKEDEVEVYSAADLQTYAREAVRAAVERERANAQIKFADLIGGDDRRDAELYRAQAKAEFTTQTTPGCLKPSED